MENKAREIMKQIRNELKENTENKPKNIAIYQAKVKRITVSGVIYFFIFVFLGTILCATAIMQNTCITVGALVMYLAITIIGLWYRNTCYESTNDKVESDYVSALKKAINKVAEDKKISDKELVLFILAFEKPRKLLRCCLFLVNLILTGIFVYYLPEYQKLSENYLINYLFFAVLVLGNILLSWSLSYLESTFEDYWSIKSFAKRLYKDYFETISESVASENKVGTS